MSLTEPNGRYHARVRLSGLAYSRLQICDLDTPAEGCLLSGSDRGAFMRKATMATVRKFPLRGSIWAKDCADGVELHGLLAAGGGDDAALAELVPGVDGEELLPPAAG